jgi:hypothetical protein
MTPMAMVLPFLQTLSAEYAGCVQDMHTPGRRWQLALDAERADGPSFAWHAPGSKSDAVVRMACALLSNGTRQSQKDRRESFNGRNSQGDGRSDAMNMAGRARSSPLQSS